MKKSITREIKGTVNSTNTENREILETMTFTVFNSTSLKVELNFGTNST